MRIDILYPELPPTHDAIGEHNRELAMALSRQDATIGLIHASAEDADQVDGVETVRLPGPKPTALKGLPSLMAERRPDWLITAYNPFSYGRYGLNPMVPWALSSTRRTVSGTKQALYIHEGFVPSRGLKLSVMGFGQRKQLRAIARPQDLVVSAIEVWVDRFSWLSPGAKIAHIPVGSNISISTATQEEARRRIKIPKDAVVLALFGGLGAGRNVPLLRHAIAAVDQPGIMVVYAGPSEDTLSDLISGTDINLLSLGRAEGGRAALALAAADVGLAPFSEGVSERRGSFLAMIGHGLATVTTRGEDTGAGLHQAANDDAFLLSEPTFDDFSRNLRTLIHDAERRKHIGRRARTYFTARHSWPILAQQYLRLLDDRCEAPCSR